MRVEAHCGPAPLRKVAYSNPIVAWACDDAPKVQGYSPADQHVTMFYLNNGDTIIPKANDLLNRYAPYRMIPVQAPMEIGADSGGSPIVWLVLPASFASHAALVVNRLGNHNIRASQDKGSGEAIAHITIARTRTGDEAQAILDKLQGSYSGSVTLEGPFIYDSAGQKIARTQARTTSSMMDVVLDMLEMS